MNTAKLLISTFCISIITLAGCTGENKGSDTHEHMEKQAEVYQCPMECEGDKTYSEPGQCPVCGMDLVIREE